jgi:hypothetical protein
MTSKLIMWYGIGRSFQGLQLFLWKLLNQLLCARVTSSKNCEIHNVTKLKKLGLLPKSCGIFCHFNATPLLVMGYSNINETQVMIAFQVWVMVCLVSLVHSWFIHEWPNSWGNWGKSLIWLESPWWMGFLGDVFVNFWLKVNEILNFE